MRRWLCQPHRKNRLIHNLFIELATEAEYDEFCDMLDNEYIDTVFDRIEIKTVVLERTPTDDYNEDDEDWEPWVPSPTITLPSSLKARHLLLNDDCDTATVDWSSFRKPLRDELLSLVCVCKSLTPTPDLVFKSLKNSGCASIRSKTCIICRNLSLVTPKLPIWIFRRTRRQSGRSTKPHPRSHSIL